MASICTSIRLSVESQTADTSHILLWATPVLGVVGQVNGRVQPAEKLRRRAILGAYGHCDSIISRLQDSWAACDGSCRWGQMLEIFQNKANMIDTKIEVHVDKVIGDVFSPS